jgi:cell shape-determining protein MreD
VTDRGASLVLFTLLLVALHFLLRVGFGLGRFAPDLLAVATLLVGRRTTGARATMTGVVLGLIEDATGVHNLGARAIGLGLAGLAASRSRRVLTGEGLGFTPAFLFVGTWVSLLVTWLVRRPIIEPATHLILAYPLDAAWAAFAGTLLVRMLPRRVAAEL